LNPGITFSTNHRMFVSAISSSFVPVIARNGNSHAFGEMVTICSDLAHFLVNTGKVIPFPAFAADPRRNVFDNDEGLTVSEVFAPPLCL